MRAVFHRPFRKQWQKLKKAERERFIDRLELYLGNPHATLLYNHSLSGQWKGYRSINIGGDLRAIYKEVDINLVEFVAIGSHNQLYD